MGLFCISRFSMRGLRKTILLSLVSICSLTSASFAGLSFAQAGSKEMLEMVMVNYPPYTIAEPDAGLVPGQRGFDVEVVDLALRDAGYDIKFTVEDWAIAQRRVKQGDATALMSCTYNNERDDWISFSSQLSQSTRGFFSIKRGLLQEPVMLDSISKLSIMAVKDYGTAYELNNAGIQIKEPANDEEAFKNLLAGKSDLFYSTKEFGNWIAREQGFDDVISFYARKKRPYYLCISKNWPKHEEIVLKFNNSLRAMRRDGRYKAIHAKYN